MIETPDASPEAVQARAFLEAAGVRGITIEGAGESWRVAIGWNEPERFVVAFSAKNPLTPNDPMYLAEQALAALIRNEGPCPHETSCETFSQPAEPMPAPETDALWAPEPEDDGGWLGEELVDAEGDAEEIPAAEAHTVDDVSDVIAAVEPLPLQDGGEEAAAVPAYPGIMPLHNELEERRWQVRAMIGDRELLLLDVAADESRRRDLERAFSDYNNTCALHLPPSEMQEAGYREYMALEARDKQIAQAARGCVRAALEADLDGLERIAAGLEEALR